MVRAAAVVALLVALSARGASTGLSTQQARTTTPAVIDGGVSTSTEGSSLSFARADHAHATVYTAVDGGTARTFASKFGDVASVLDFGAVPNDGNDDTPALQRALLAIPDGGVLRVPAGTYNLTGTAGLTISRSVTIEADRGAKFVAPSLDYDGDTRGAVVLIAGSLTQNVASLTVDAARGDTALTVDGTTGLVAGDMVLLRSVNESFNDERTVASDGYGYHKGEHNVVSAASGTALTLKYPTQDSYLQASTLRVDEITPVEGVTIRGLEVDCQASTGGEQFGFIARYFRGVTLDGVTVRNCGYAGVYFLAGVDARLVDSTVTDSANTSLGYGTYFFSVQSGTAQGNTYREVRHAVDVSGQNNEGYAISRGVSILNNDVTGGLRAGISTHGGAEHVLIQGNKVRSNNEGIIVRSPNTTVRDNHVWALSGTGTGAPGAITVGEATNSDVGRAGEGLRIEGNEVWDAPVNGLYVKSPLNNAVIRGNVFRYLGVRRDTESPSGMYIRSSTIRQARIEDNDIDLESASSVVGGIVIDPNLTTDGTNQKEIHIRGNRIKLGSGAGRVGIQIDGNPSNTAANYSSDIVIEDNLVTGGGTHVSLASGYFARVRIQRNQFIDFATASIASGSATFPNETLTQSGNYYRLSGATAGHFEGAKKWGYGSTTWDPANIATGVCTNTSVTVTEGSAALGDFVAVAIPNGPTGLAFINGSVSGSNAVNVVLCNFTGSDLNVASGTVRVFTWRSDT